MSRPAARAAARPRSSGRARRARSRTAAGSRPGSGAARACGSRGPRRAEAVDVGGRALVERRPVAQGVEAAAQLGRALGVEPAQEVPRRRRAGTRSSAPAPGRRSAPDRLELRELAARREPDVVVRERRSTRARRRRQTAATTAPRRRVRCAEQPRRSAGQRGEPGRRATRWRAPWRRPTASRRRRSTAQPTTAARVERAAPSSARPGQPEADRRPRRAPRAIRT